MRPPALPVPTSSRAITPELRIRDAVVDDVHAHQTRQVFDALKGAPVAHGLASVGEQGPRREGDR
jgi:hypothetical protein